MALVVLACTGATLVGASGASAAQSVTVCPPGPPACNYPTIQAAIDSASDGETIVIAPGRYGENSLAIPGLSGAARLDLEGAGAGHTTIDGTGTAQVLEIGANASVAVEGVTITGGNAGSADGGGVRNLGTLTFTNVTVSDSVGAYGAGILNGGRLTMTNGVITGNVSSYIGGGIDNAGTLMLNHSTVNANAAANVGGGLTNTPGATAALNNTTVTGNAATGSLRGPGSGGGIANLSGVVLHPGSVKLNNSAVTANAATTGGGIWNRQPLTLNHTTVSGNTATAFGGGITALYPFTAHNSSIVGNQPNDCVGLC